MNALFVFTMMVALMAMMMEMMALPPRAWAVIRVR
jgi:hypothetical protein